MKLTIKIDTTDPAQLSALRLSAEAIFKSLDLMPLGDTDGDSFADRHARGLNAIADALYDAERKFSED